MTIVSDTRLAAEGRMPDLGELEFEPAHPDGLEWPGRTAAMDKKIYAVLWERWKASGENQFVSYRGVAEMAKVGEATVHRWVRDMEARGLVELHDPGVGGLDDVEPVRFSLAALVVNVESRSKGATTRFQVEHCLSTVTGSSLPVPYEELNTYIYGMCSAWKHHPHFVKLMEMHPRHHAMDCPLRGSETLCERCYVVLVRREIRRLTDTGPERFRPDEDRWRYGRDFSGRQLPGPKGYELAVATAEDPGPYSLQEVAAMVGMTRSGAWKLLRKLTALGLTMKQPDGKYLCVFPSEVTPIARGHDVQAEVQLLMEVRLSFAARCPDGARGHALSRTATRLAVADRATGADDSISTAQAWRYQTARRQRAETSREDWYERCSAKRFTGPAPGDPFRRVARGATARDGSRPVRESP